MKTIGVFRQAAILDFAEAEDALDVAEHVLDSRTDTRLAAVRLAVSVAERTIAIRAFIREIASARRFLAHH